MDDTDAHIAIIGAGIAGIATAYHLAVRHGCKNVILMDCAPPMSFTSAQSGENYRDWWPHPVMSRFINHSIDLMEQIAAETDNRIHLTRRGYALATREGGADAMVAALPSQSSADAVRVHDKASSTYQPADTAHWHQAPEGVDVLAGGALVHKAFPQFGRDITAVAHIRRAGDVSGQQLGSVMLEAFKAADGRLVQADVAAVRKAARFQIEARADGEPHRVSSDVLVNAAGPYLGAVAAMLDVSLPVETVLQQKIAFEDRAGAVPRPAPFVVDLDRQVIDWSEEERDLLAGSESTLRFAAEMPGGIHCRPEGGASGSWVKLGWAYNSDPSAPLRTPPLETHFPEIVLRGAARLQPALKTYFGRLPRGMAHYGGYYTMTRENWPLVGPMGPEDAFMVGALSGFGTMAACAAGALCADWITGAALPSYAHALSLMRYGDAGLMAELEAQDSRGIL